MRFYGVFWKRMILLNFGQGCITIVLVLNAFIDHLWTSSPSFIKHWRSLADVTTTLILKINCYLHRHPGHKSSLNFRQQDSCLTTQQNYSLIQSASCNVRIIIMINSNLYYKSQAGPDLGIPILLCSCRRIWIASLPEQFGHFFHIVVANDTNCKAWANTIRELFTICVAITT